MWVVEVGSCSKEGDVWVVEVGCCSKEGEVWVVEVGCCSKVEVCYCSKGTVRCEVQ